MTMDNAATCVELLRDQDRDRYLAVLLAPEPYRRSLTALYAFNAELARIRDVVREPLPGEVRLQYWRDLLNGQDHGATASNPVAAELMRAIESDRLPLPPLQAMIDARLFDLYDDPMESRGMFEGYAGETASALIQLASIILDPEAASLAAERAGHAGVAQAVAGMLLLLPRHCRRGQVYIPLDILRATGLERESFLLGEDRGRIGAAIEAFAGLGREHLEASRRAGQIARSIVPAYLAAALAEPVLRSAQVAGADIMTQNIRPSQWRRQWRMLRTAVTRRL